MKMPGFTADASIYRNKRQYNRVSNLASFSGKAGVYQAGSIQPALSASCWSYCYCCGKLGTASCCSKCFECAK